MDKIGRNATFQVTPSNDGNGDDNNDSNMVLEDWTKILKSAIGGDASARIDIDSVDGSLKSLGETLNLTIDKMAKVELLQKRAESFIKENPQAIAVLGPDKSRININREYERIWRGSHDELMAKKLHDFAITITGGEGIYASYETKQLAISDMELKWPNGEKTYVKLYQVPILDDNDDILINYYIYQDLTKDISVEKYLNTEVERLKVNLEMFARGDLKFNSVVDEGNEYTTVVRDDFVQINENIDGVRDAVSSVLMDVDTLAEAAVEGKLDTRVDVNAHNGEFAMVIEGVNNTLDSVVGPLNVAADFIEDVAAGKKPELITDEYSGDYARVKASANKCHDVLEALVNEVAALTRAAVDGELDTRGNVERFDGTWMQIVGGINDTLDAFVGPMNVTAEYVDRISKGDIPGKVTDEWRGDFNEIKNNLNHCIEGLGGLVEANAVLQKMSVNDYTTKVESNSQGVFAEVAAAVNSVREILVHIQNIVVNTARGDLSELEAARNAGKRSENDRMVPSFIAMTENLQALVDDAEMLAEAGVNGQLDVRADATRHPGAYGEVISGINNCLDAFVGPMNVTAEYVDRISKGDIPEKVTDEWRGDFNEIKNNLNGCIDAVNLLVVDTNMLVDATAAGKLTARADVSQHAGDYAKIVGGINQTLDVINAPFREVNAAIAQLDITADETSRGADEIGKAAEQVAVTSQLCADLSTSLINQIEAVDRQIADLSASNEEIASTSQEVHEHAVQTAEIGEKARKLGAKANAKMDVVEGIAKQSVDEMQNLNVRMKEIDNVVKQVNDITNQINLLALNAAIEAARAGEHGRGFAVVAGEVRNLAVEAKAATGQIDRVIAEVQAISAKTAEGIGSAHAEIGSGVASVNETIEALNEIVQGSQDMKVNIDEIAKAIEEQANMANRIVEAMEESGRLTRENQGQAEELASLAEEASASTEEIGSSIYEVKNMAGDLKQTMDRFEV